MRPRAGADWQRFRTGVAAGASTGLELRSSEVTEVSYLKVDVHSVGSKKDLVLDAEDAWDRGAPAVAGRLAVELWTQPT